MRLFKRKKIYEERASTSAETEIAPDISADLLKALLNNENISREEALEIPSISGAISIISGIVSSLPIKLYRQGDNVTEIKNDSRLALLNHDTQDTLTTTQFWRAMIEDYYVGKGAYAYINRNLLEVKSLHYIENNCISILKNYDPIFKDYKICVNGTAREPYDFFKILRNTKDGMSGVPIQEEKRTLFSVAYHTKIGRAHV